MCLGMKRRKKAKSLMDMLLRYLFCARTDDSDLRRSSWFNLVCHIKTFYWLQIGAEHKLCYYSLFTEEAMSKIYRASYVSLHVRKSNWAALGLYKDTLHFTVKGIEKKYCGFDCDLAGNYTLNH